MVTLRYTKIGAADYYTRGVSDRTNRSKQLPRRNYYYYNRGQFTPFRSFPNNLAVRIILSDGGSLPCHNNIIMYVYEFVKYNIIITRCYIIIMFGAGNASKKNKYNIIMKTIVIRRDH